MATSSSCNEGWRASALIFSGRSNPEWAISDAIASDLVSLWSALPATRAQEMAPGLGYHGCALLDARRRWQAFDGVAVMWSGASSETRSDRARAFERAILATAPAGTIPATVCF